MLKTIHITWHIKRPNRSNEGIAYLGYKFDLLIRQLEIDLALWGTSESLKPSDCTALLQYKNYKGQWVTKLDLLNDITLTTNRANQQTYKLKFDNPINEFRIYSTSPVVGLGNTGRLCIGNMTVFYMDKLTEENRDTCFYEKHNYDWHIGYFDDGEFVFRPHSIIEAWIKNDQLFGKCEQCGEIVSL